MDLIGSSVPWTEIIGVGVCLLMSAFFSGCETACTHIPEIRARHLIESEPQRFGILKFWLENKKRVLTTLLVGNNLVNILCSVLAYRAALRLVPSFAEAVSVFGLTFVILVFAEVTPKSVALHHAEKLIVPMLRIVWLVDKLLWVVSTALLYIPGLILKKTDASTDELLLSEDEIAYQIRLSHDQAVFEEKEHGKLLVSAVDFSDTSVKEIMIPRTEMFCLKATTPLAQAVDSVITSGHSRIPVYMRNKDNIIGLLHSKDLLGQLQRRDANRLVNIENLVRKPPFFVPETQKIHTLLTEMRHRRQHMSIVVDEFGGTAGLITLEDIIEELVGEIRDEFDAAEPMAREVGPDTWIVNALLSLNDLKDITGIELPDTGEYESVGGFVIAQYGSIPPKGALIESPGMLVKVLAGDARHVERVEIKLVAEQEAAAQND